MIQNCTQCKWFQLRPDPCCLNTKSPTYPKFKKLIIDPCIGFEQIYEPVKPKAEHNHTLNICLQCKYIQDPSKLPSPCLHPSLPPPGITVKWWHEACDKFEQKEVEMTHNCSNCQFLRETPSGRLRCTHKELSIHNVHVTAEQQACGLFLAKNKNAHFLSLSLKIPKNVTPSKKEKKAQTRRGKRIKVGARKVKY